LLLKLYFFFDFVFDNLLNLSATMVSKRLPIGLYTRAQQY